MQYIYSSRDKYTAGKTADRIITKLWKTTHNILSLTRQCPWVWRLEIEEVEKKELKLIDSFTFLMS